MHSAQRIYLLPATALVSSIIAPFCRAGAIPRPNFAASSMVSGRVLTLPYHLTICEADTAIAYSALKRGGLATTSFL